jgi:hypothetical protein
MSFLCPFNLSACAIEMLPEHIMGYQCPVCLQMFVPDCGGCYGIDLSTRSIQGATGLCHSGWGGGGELKVVNEGWLMLDVRRKNPQA